MNSRLMHSIRPLSLPVLLLLSVALHAHHTLGVNQAGKATDSPQIPISHEIFIDDYFLTLTVLPGQPRPGETTRVVVYTKNVSTDTVYLGPMRFTVRPQGLFGLSEPILEAEQQPIEDRHIQLIDFKDVGSYEVNMSFAENGRDYETALLLHVGSTFEIFDYLLFVLLLAGACGLYYKTRRRRKPPA